jgi:hypothetical protein
MAKIGARNRVELAIWAHERGARSGAADEPHPPRGR